MEVLIGDGGIVGGGVLDGARTLYTVVGGVRDRAVGGLGIEGV